MPACATPRARPALTRCSARAPPPARSPTSNRPRRSSSAAPTPPRTTRSSVPASSRRRCAVRHLVVIDPRRIELADYADVHLQLRPGTNVAAAQRDGRRDRRGRPRRRGVRRRAGRRRRRVRGLRRPRSRPERVERHCGVAAGDDPRRRHGCYATAQPGDVVPRARASPSTHQGTETVMCLVNLALLTGNLGRPGAGVNPLRGQNNVQGAAHMGCEPAHLPGYAPLVQARGTGRRGLGCSTSRVARPGRDRRCSTPPAAGELRALWRRRLGHPPHPTRRRPRRSGPSPSRPRSSCRTCSSTRPPASSAPCSCPRRSRSRRTARS